MEIASVVWSAAAARAWPTDGGPDESQQAKKDPGTKMNSLAG